MDLYLSSEHSCCIRNFHRRINILAFSLVTRFFSDFDFDQQISVLSIVPFLSFPFQTHRLPVCNACRNMHFKVLALSVTGRKRKPFITAKYRFFKADRYFRLDILPSFLMYSAKTTAKFSGTSKSASSAKTSGSVESTFFSKQFVKNIIHIGRTIKMELLISVARFSGRIRLIKSSISKWIPVLCLFHLLRIKTCLQRNRTVLIIQFPLLRISQHFVSFRYFLKNLFRIWISFIHIRMIFFGKFSICLFNRCFVCIFIYSQNFVKISFCCHNYHLTNHKNRNCFLKCTSCHSISVRAFSTKTYLYLCFSFVIALFLALVKHVC